MRLTFVPPAFALSCFVTSHVSLGQSKILLPSMLSGIFGAAAPADPVPQNISASATAVDSSDAPSTDAELNGSKTSGSADLVPKQEVVQELAETAQLTGQASPENDAVATQSDVRAAEAEATTEKLVSAASQDRSGVPSQPIVSQEVGVTEKAVAPASLEKQITEEDAVKNSELLQSVSESAEASWLSKVSKESATEALLPLIALTPVLAAAGFHADIETSSSGAPFVRFPSIDYAVEVEDLQNYN